MSAKVPGFSSYQTTPFTFSLTTTPSSFGSLTGGWIMEMGSTAILLVQMPADTEEIAICVNGFSGVTSDIPDNALVKAKQDTANSIAFGLTSLPVRYTDIASGNIRIVANGTITAVCQFLPITEPGD
jgi:hypothetical protein